MKKFFFNFAGIGYSNFSEIAYSNLHIKERNLTACYFELTYSFLFSLVPQL